MTLTGITTRPVTLSYIDRDKVSRGSHRIPAGTEVYVGRERPAGYAGCKAPSVEIRLPGTLYTQRVYWGTVTCP